MNASDLAPAMAFNLTTRQLAVLLLVSNGNETPMRTIAALLHISPPVVTRAFDSLCEHGLLKRHRSDHDRRDVYGTLTAQGQKLVEKMK